LERHHRDNVPDARRLRQTMTRSEELPWAVLRDRRSGGLKFRRQHPVENFVLDFYCAEQRLGVEIDGGAHANAEQRERDASRQDILRAKGIRLVRIPAGLVERDLDAALERIHAAIAAPSP